MTNKEKREIALKHISFSRMNAWKSSKKEFERAYFQGVRKPTNKYMRFGNRMDQLANDEIQPETTAEKIVRDQLHDIFDGKPEVELTATLKYEEKEYKLLGYADRILPDMLIERKSGTTKTATKRCSIKYGKNNKKLL